MNLYQQFRIIARGWWRNRLFFLISLFSLTVGLGCTNLLLTFFIHEYNVEKENPYRENIYMLRQDHPMQEGSKVLFTAPHAAEQIRAKYTEISSMLCVRGTDVTIHFNDGRKVETSLFLEAKSKSDYPFGHLNDLLADSTDTDLLRLVRHLVVCRPPTYP